MDVWKTHGQECGVLVKRSEGDGWGGKRTGWGKAG